MTQPNYPYQPTSAPRIATPPISEFPWLNELEPPTRPESGGRVRKPMPNTYHARAVSAQIPPMPTFGSTPQTKPQPQQQNRQFDEQLSGGPTLMAPPPVLQADLPSNSKITKARPQQSSRPQSREPSRTRPDTSNSNQGPASRSETPVLKLPWESQSRPVTPNLNDGAVVGGGRSVSMPNTPALNGQDKKPPATKGGWFGKGKKDKEETGTPLAWVAGHPDKPPYDTAGLLSGRPMPEIWDETDGNCLVYLFPRKLGKGPSFKIDSAVFASSPALTRLAFGEVFANQAGKNGADRGARHPLPFEARTQNLSLQDPTTPPRSPRQARTRVANSTSSPSSSISSNSRGRLSNLSDPPAETHLYLPIKLQNAQDPTKPPPAGSEDDASNDTQQDLQTLVDIRNFFAFLVGSSLLATAQKPTFFHIFMTISAILRTYEFSNLDGSTFGEIASASFDAYVAELRLADVRGSRDKTIEGIVLGERMRSVALYNEAFTHGAGKYEALVNLKSPKFSLLSSATDNRLIRAAMELDKRREHAEQILKDFDVPMLFAGIGRSKVSEERKEGVMFGAWKEAFLGARKWYLSFLKGRYGEWPPKKHAKAGGKKGGAGGEGEVEMGGLDRVVLREVYKDVCELYDMLVDRTALTSRTADGVDLAAPREDATTRGLRAVLSEYDRSSIPVKPPIPFDLPILPRLPMHHSRNFSQDITDKEAATKQQQREQNRKLAPDELSGILLQSWNKDALARPSPLLQSFWENEKRAARSSGSTLSDVIDLRVGYWIFIYVVLQALPMLACDAPGLLWTKGVRYFLCMPPRKGVPWANPNDGVPGAANFSGAGAGAGGGAGSRKTWFAVGDEGDVVCLPADAVEHGVDGVFKRSHCWVVAEKWTQGYTLDPPPAVLEAGVITPGVSRPPSISYSESGAATPPPPWSTPPNSGLLAPDSRPGSRTSSLSAGATLPASKRNSSLSLGLEALPLPPGISPEGGFTLSPSPLSGSTPPAQQQQPPAYFATQQGYQSSAGQMEWERPRSAQLQVQQQREHAVDSAKTFDAILAQVEGKKKARKSWLG